MGDVAHTQAAWSESHTKEWVHQWRCCQIQNWMNARGDEQLAAAQMSHYVLTVHNIILYACLGLLNVYVKSL